MTALQDKRTISLVVDKKPPPIPTTRAEKRLAFSVAFKNGSTISEAARIAKVSRNTGQAWANKIREHRTAFDAEKSTVMTRVEGAERLTELARSESTDPRDVVKAIETASRILGYMAPTRSQVEVHAVPANVEAWLSTLLTVDISPDAPALPETHKQLPAKADE